jgi:hypothetical protein
MVSKIESKEGVAQVEGWLKDMGCHPKRVSAADTNWQFEVDYPVSTPHRIAIANPIPFPRAVFIGTRVMFSPEHLEVFGTFENEDKQTFLDDLQSTLNREFVEFRFEGAGTGLSCPTAFQITAIRYDDGLSLDSLARTVSSVYKAELAGISCVQQKLGRRNLPAGGGDFPFKMPRLQ